MIIVRINNEIDFVFQAIFVFTIQTIRIVPAHSVGQAITKKLNSCHGFPAIQRNGCDSWHFSLATCHGLTKT
jgi:hypothetical protein